MDVLEHVSTKPWSDFQESDYTLAQWHNACLIHLHDGPPTSKNQCKLPVKTPNGVVNKNGVFAAAAALAGARTALQAPIEKKAQAARKLISLYQQMNAKPPPSLFSLGHSMDINSFLEHHGIKGQKWGIRRDPKTGIRPIATTLNKNSFGIASKRNVDRHNKRSPETKRKIASAAVGVGAAFVTANIITGTTLNLPLAAIAGSAAGVAGYKFTKNALEKDHNKTFGK